jgi:hypothetical protein
MGRLRVAIGALSAVLTALIARTVTDGLTVAGALAEALIVALLIASVGLWRYGRRRDGCIRGYAHRRVPRVPR